jgi:hypothetical protein
MAAQMSKTLHNCYIHDGLVDNDKDFRHHPFISSSEIQSSVHCLQRASEEGNATIHFHTFVSPNIFHFNKVAKN